MKPKQRHPQRQSGRLFFRGKDHREYIMHYGDVDEEGHQSNEYDAYTNGIWVTKDDKDELAWWKYPHESLITAGNNIATLGWLDTERQWQHRVPMVTGQRSGAIFRFDGFAVTWNSYSSIDYIYVTTDGCIWKRIDASTRPHVHHYAFYYGHNAVCSISGSTLLITKFEMDEETKEVTFKNESRSLLFGDFKFLCQSEEGCFLGRWERNEIIRDFWDLHIFKVTDDTYRETYTEKAMLYEPLWPRGAGAPGACGFVIAGNYRTYTKPDLWLDTYNNVVVAFATADDGETWESIEVTSRFSSFYQKNNTAPDRYDVFERGGIIYAIGAGNDGQKKTGMVKFEDGAWAEVALPYWVDVPVLKGGGKCVHPLPTMEETIRLGIRYREQPENPDEDEEKPEESVVVYDIMVFDLMRQLNGNNYPYDLNNGAGNIRTEDGEIVDNSEPFMLLGQDGWVFYFDNMQFIKSSKAFCFLAASIDSTDDIEKVQQYDYVN